MPISPNIRMQAEKATTPSSGYCWINKCQSPPASGSQLEMGSAIIWILLDQYMPISPNIRIPGRNGYDIIWILWDQYMPIPPSIRIQEKMVMPSSGYCWIKILYANLPQHPDPGENGYAIIWILLDQNMPISPSIRIQEKMVMLSSGYCSINIWESPPPTSGS
jgi:hypothetical protein